MERLNKLPFPSTFDKTKRLINQLKTHYKNHYFLLTLFHCIGFLLLQTWCIPGTIFFNMFAGAIFDIFIAWPLCLLLNSLGAFFCYNISKYFGGGLLETEHLKPHTKKLTHFVKKQRMFGDIFFYLVSFRLVPMSPNWAMNIIFPHIGITSKLFFSSVILGLAPWNYIACSTGVILSDLVANNEVMTPQTYLLVI